MKRVGFIKNIFQGETGVEEAYTKLSDVTWNLEGHHPHIIKKKLYVIIFL